MRYLDIRLIKQSGEKLVKTSVVLRQTVPAGLNDCGKQIKACKYLICRLVQLGVFVYDL